MTDPRLDQPVLKLCDRCGRIISRWAKSEINDEIICMVCVEGEMEVKDGRHNVPLLLEKE